VIARTGCTCPGQGLTGGEQLPCRRRCGFQTGRGKRDPRRRAAGSRVASFAGGRHTCAHFVLWEETGAAGEARGSGRRRAAGLRAASMADPKERDHASPCLPAVSTLLTLAPASSARRSGPLWRLSRGECPGGCRGAVRLRIGGCVIVGEGRRRRCFPRSGERKKDRGGRIGLKIREPRAESRAQLFPSGGRGNGRVFVPHVLLFNSSVEV